MFRYRNIPKPLCELCVHQLTIDESMNLILRVALPGQLRYWIIEGVASKIFFEARGHREFERTEHVATNNPCKRFKRTTKYSIEDLCQCDSGCVRKINSTLDRLVSQLHAEPLLAEFLVLSFRHWCRAKLPKRHPMFYRKPLEDTDDEIDSDIESYMMEL